jgi:PAS domain S-box-containing protein
VNYNFTIDSLIEFATALAAVATIIILWKNRKSPEVKYLIYIQVLVAIWAVTYAFEFGTSDLATKVMWSKLSYLGIGFLPVLYFLFTTAFSQKHHLLTNRNIILLSIIPVITIGMALTNDSHHLIWTEVTKDPVRNIAYYHHGIWFWGFIIYTHALLFTGLFNLFHSIYKFTAYYKSQFGTLVFASLFPIFANIMYISGVNPYPGFDWTPVSFVASGLLIAFGVVRYRMFDLVPYARNTLIDIMDDGALVINPEGFIEDCNQAACKIFKSSKQELIHKLFIEKANNHNELTEALNSKNNTTVLLDIDGKHYQVRISPIFYKNKNFSGNLLLIHDITTIKLAQESLTQTNKRLIEEIDDKKKLIDDLDSFAHTVAHDLKNSLGSIASSSELIEEIIQNGDTKFLLELADLIKKSAIKSMKITQELLILATVNHHDVKKTPLKMDVIINEAITHLNGNVGENGVKISQPEQWFGSVGYSPWIEEVWVNFLSNAIKYGGQPPVISVGSERLENGNIKYWIKDNGDGLNEEQQSKLFQKYTRLTSRKVDGHGLGLSIVKRIIEKLDGSVGAESSAIPGEGCTFYFILPEADEHHA